MLKIESNWLDLRHLDDLAAQKTMIHQLDPRIKLITTLLFIIVVTSYGKYEITGLIPFVFFPFVLILLGNLPWSHLLKRLLLVSPFVLFVGIFNPLFDQTPLLRIHSLVITGGWVSFLSLTLRLALTVTAALILVATTGIDALCTALLRLGVPRVIVTQVLFMYRYLHVLLDEFIRLTQAYSLRSFHGEGLRFRAWGSLVGQLLIRTIDRAQRIYQAMLCRGFDGEIRLLRPGKIAVAETVYVTGWTAFFLIARFINIPQALGKVFLGVYQ
ncbi:MAG: cobalt ECF transporter T component CbiQ [Bacillota bacterium]